MNKKLVLWSVTVSLGGLLFGMDVASISGAEQRIQKLWGLSDMLHGTVVAMALYGTIVGAAFGSFPANWMGRRKTLFIIGILFLVSAIGCAIVNDVITFMVFRFMGGLSIGASSVVAPVYIAEIAPPRHRGKMGIAFQLNIVAGILLAYLFNYLLQGVGGENDWRYMLGIIAVPSFIFCVMIVFTPESPRWLLLYRNDEAGARKIFEQSGANANELIKGIKESVRMQQRKDSLFSGKFSKPLLLTFLIAFFNQLSGINAIIYFAPRVFELAGLAKNAAFLSTAGIGIVNFIFTVIGWYLIDRSGRRKLMYLGSVGYIVSLTLMAFAFAGYMQGGITIFVFLFIAAHAIGQGSVIWVFISEIFSNSVRAAGMSFGSLTHWLFAAIISQSFTFFANQLGGIYIFGFFAVMMCFQLLFVWKMMPETKGIPLEQMNKSLVH